MSFTSPVAVNFGAVQCVWVTVYAPVGQTPGLYQGTITVTTANSHSYAINLAVNVRNFTLPNKSSLKTQFGLHSYPLCKFYTNTLADQNNLIGAVDNWDFAWDSPNLGIMNKWTAFTRKYRLSPAGGFGWAEYDARSNPYMWPVSANSGVVQFAQWNSMVGSNINQNGNMMGVMGVSKTPGLAQQASYTNLMNQFLPQMQSNLTANGWVDLSYISLPDEPAWATLGADFLSVATLLKGLAPNIKTLATTAPPHVHAAYSNLLNYVDTFVPLMDSGFTTINNGLQQSGKEIWHYTCVIPFNPYPHLGVYQAGVDARIIPWMTWKYNLDGLLYWGVDVFGDANISSSVNPKWPARPWTMQGYPYSPGDGMLMYPGANGQPWSSVRLEGLRDGMEDYEYLALLSKSINYLSISQPANMASLKTQAQNLLNGLTNLISTKINFTHNLQDIPNYRSNMADLLDQIAPPAITFVDDFSVSNSFTWLPSPASTATNWVMTTSSNQYQLDVGNQTSVSMMRKADVGSSWEVDADVQWVRSRNGSDAGYGVGGVILANSATSPLSGDYLSVFVNRSTNNATSNYIRPVAEWRIGGVSGSYYPGFSVEATGVNQYRFAVRRVANNVVVTLTAHGVAPMSFTLSSIPAANLDTLRHPGLAGYLSVNKFKNILIFEN